MSGADKTGWAEVLPAHIPGVQVLDRLLRCGWPDAEAPAGLVAEAERFLPQVAGTGPGARTARAFLMHEIATDRAGVLARLSFLRAAIRDVALHGDLILADPEAFMAQSETFALFDYARSAEMSEDALQATRQWVDYVAHLTRTEAPVLLPLIDIPAGATVLEPGGNDGTFARALIGARAVARHVVLDLPAVCELGRRRGTAPGLCFVAGDMRAGNWCGLTSGAPDVVLFKSVLHDWPEAVAAQLLAEALCSLAPGGQIVIAERDAFRGMTGGTAMDYANLVFAAFYRAPEVYTRMLRAMRPDVTITVSRTVIDTDWYVLKARMDK